MVGRHQKSCSTVQRGRRSGFNERDIWTPQPPGQLRHAHFLTPLSTTNHTSPLGIMVLPGCWLTFTNKKSKFRSPKLRNINAKKCFIDSTDYAKKWIYVTATPGSRGTANRTRRNGFACHGAILYAIEPANAIMRHTDVTSKAC